MATYFLGAPADVQSDGLQTLYLYGGYSGDLPPSTATASNMLLLNSAANSISPASLSPTPPPSQLHHHQHFLGVPLQEANRTPPIDISALHGFVPRLHHHHYNLNSLSLSLSPQQRPPPPPQHNYASYRLEHEIPPPMPTPPSVAAAMSTASGGEVSGVSNGIAGLHGVLMGSKYLKAAQQLLDEVVNVAKGVKEESLAMSGKALAKSSKGEEGGDGLGETSWKRGVVDLTTTERQELQMKKAKLISMLDEVEQRYRQYHHQMQIVITSFEAAAGFGSAKTYTALALKTISKQFRCLRDAISNQIRATSKTLGEEDCLAGVKSSDGVGSRLRLVDHQLRQQRALQQLGMMQHNAWRPQRGLPERAVSVLRAWLFEHFLHPYPKDSDKHILAKQTGLTRSQVSNWFINARVRLWKPMVEEMYLEETKGQEQQQQNNGDDKTSKSELNEDSAASKSSAPQESSPTRTEQTDSLLTKQDLPIEIKSSPIMIPSMQATYNDDDVIFQEKLKKARSNEALHLTTMTHPMNMMGMDLKLPDDTNSSREFLLKFGDGRHGVVDNGYNFPGGGFVAYPMGGNGSFEPQQFAPRFPGNGVSLTLGLPHCESLSLSGAQPSYLSNESIPFGRRLEMSTQTTDYSSLGNNPSVAHSSNAFEGINIQDRKRFAAQLLPDFVA